MASHFNEPLFVISVAARLVQMHPQTLRKYEREGLIAPSAHKVTCGSTRTGTLNASVRSSISSRTSA